MKTVFFFPILIGPTKTEARMPKLAVVSKLAGRFAMLLSLFHETYFAIFSWESKVPPPKLPPQ